VRSFEEIKNLRNELGCTLEKFEIKKRQRALRRQKNTESLQSSIWHERRKFEYYLYSEHERRQETHGARDPRLERCYQYQEIFCVENKARRDNACQFCGVASQSQNAQGRADTDSRGPAKKISEGVTTSLERHTFYARKVFSWRRHERRLHLQSYPLIRRALYAYALGYFLQLS
jgi:hypothetical protein